MLVLLGATTRRKSRSCCIFRYFLERYLRYFLEKGASAFTWILDFSRLTVIFSPRFPVLPSTLMRFRRNFSRSLVSMMLSSDGCVQSMEYFRTCFLPLTATFFFRPLTMTLPVTGRLCSVACGA